MLYIYIRLVHLYKSLEIKETNKTSLFAHVLFKALYVLFRLTLAGHRTFITSTFSRASPLCGAFSLEIRMQRIHNIRQRKDNNHKLLVSILTSLSLIALLPMVAVLFNAPDSWIDNTTLAEFGVYVALAFNAIAIPVVLAIHHLEQKKLDY